MKNLAGKAAIVTGAGRGIGRAIALELATQGAAVVVVDPGLGRGGEATEDAPAAQVVGEIEARGGRAVAALQPVDDYSAAGAIVGQCVESFGRVDVVVNCAGVLRERMIWNLGEDDWDTVIRVHLKGHYNMCHHAAKVMRGQRGGRLINFASDAWRGSVGQANYAAAKGGIVSLTRALARELGRYGVTANAICPIAATRMTLNQGVIDGMKRRLESGLISQERYDAIMAMPGPEFAAPMVAYLATAAAADVNGQIFHVEKGRVSIYSEPVEEKALLKAQDDGLFTVEELMAAVPGCLLVGHPNPAPAESELN
ncbi:MAG: SDR family NAD(P)-dependent oxidoreductase [Gammaproteobacteria bacterium]|nr:SDR family NAD(P)-dependent oxidoreductase [Gammaproteobacteria bacterium]